MAKAKGKEKIVASDVPAEAEEGIATDATAEPTPSEPVKIKEAPETTPAGSDKPEDADKNSEESENEEGKEDATVDTEMTSAVPEGENKEEGDGKEDVEGNKKADNASNKKAKRQRKWKKKTASGDASAPNNAEASAGEKGKTLDFNGLIFMCNSKTKNDCYQYKVMGLPEGKKDVVAKVYKGMRLFLFDIDLKLMYGIYKASSSGGYNIEQKAFKSAFPSQVRFTVLKDCNPLPEEKFKAAIKSNYYGKNKFNPQLSQEQVKNLCKLFVNENKATVKPKRSVAKEPVSAVRDKRGPRGPRPNEHRARRPVYPRGSYALAPPRQVLMAPPPLSYAPPSYGYERIEYREPPMAYDRDPYSSYREPAPYREPLYPASMSSGYAPPPPHYRY